MKRLFFCLLALSVVSPAALAQKLWTETDRAYLVENMKRTRDELVRETETLTTDQWNFRETPERWTIAEITEHLALWEVIFARETGIALRNTPEPDLNKTSKPDAWYVDFILEEKLHTAPDYARPTGFIRDENNLTFFRRTRDQTIRFLETTEADLRSHFEPTSGGQKRNVHQVFIVQWGHVDRHLRQIRKVKAHPDFPKLSKLWTAAERSALLTDLKRTRDLIAEETANLTEAQWNFRESPDRWSIAGIVEHLADWEMLMFRQSEIALESRPTPDPVRPRWTDAQWLTWVRDDVRPGKSPPYSEPTGAAKGLDYRANFIRLRGLTMQFIETTDADFRRHFEPGGDDVHQLFVITWGHAERHLRQLQKVKAHPNFPKSKINLSKK